MINCGDKGSPSFLSFFSVAFILIVYIMMKPVHCGYS